MLNVWEFYQKLREEESILFSTEERCHFAGTKEDVDFFLRSEDVTVDYPFRASRQVFGETMLDSDTSKSLLIKKAISSFFSVKAVKCYEQIFITSIIQNIFIETLLVKDTIIDFEKDIAQRIPTQIILAIFGIDIVHDRYIYDRLDKLVRYIDNSANSLELATMAKAELFDFLRKCINGDINLNKAGLINLLDKSIFKDEDDMLSTLLMVLTAGMATTIAALNILIVNIYSDQFNINEFRENNSFVKEFVETGLTQMPPLHATVRFVKTPHVYKGVELKKNQTIKLFLASANRDTGCPMHQGSSDKKGKTPSFTFGKGKHVCLGGYLALTELIIFVNEFIPYKEKFVLNSNYDSNSLSGMAIKTFKNVQLTRKIYE